MKTEEIIQNNKLIAEFMNLDVLYNKYVHHETALINKVTLMKYHSYWDWLMSVIKKVRDLNYNSEFESDLTITFESIFDIDYTFSEFMNNDTEGIYFRVIEFIKWYNENK